MDEPIKLFVVDRLLDVVSKSLEKSSLVYLNTEFYNSIHDGESVEPFKSSYLGYQYLEPYKYVKYRRRLLRWPPTCSNDSYVEIPRYWSKHLDRFKSDTLVIRAPAIKKVYKIEFG